MSKFFNRAPKLGANSGPRKANGALKKGPEQLPSPPVTFVPIPAVTFSNGSTIAYVTNISHSEPAARRKNLTVEEVRDLVNSFTVGRPLSSLFAPKFDVWVSFHGISISCSVTAPHRDTGERIPLNMARGGQDYPAPSYVYDALRGMLHELILHETDESITVNGARMFDPHLRPPYV